MVTYVESLLPGDLFLLQSSKTKSETLNHHIDIRPSDEPEDETDTMAANATPFLPRNTQEKIIDEVFLYLLGSEDARLRLETAKSLARLVSNLSCFEATSSGSQNVLLAAGEGLLKGGGFAGNLFGSGVAENDACNAGSIQFLFGSQTGRGTRSGSSSSCGNVASGSGDGNRSTGFNSATSISYSQKQVNGILDFILFKARSCREFRKKIFWFDVFEHVKQQ